MTRLGRIASALTLAAATSLAPAAASAHTLLEALRAAYQNSDVLEQNRALLRVQDENVGLQLSGLRPIINFVASSDWDNRTDQLTNSIGLTLSLLAFDNNVTRFAAEAAEQQILATRERLVDLEQQVLLDAVTAYMQLWRDLQVVAVRQSNVRVVTQQLRAAEDRFEVGEDTRTDVALAEAQLATARSNLAAAQGQAEISQQLFSLAIGLSHDHAVDTPPRLPGIPAGEDEASAIARQTHPLIAALQFEVRAAEFNLAAAQADFGPDVQITGRVTQDPADLFGEPTVSLGLQITQPIFTGGRLPALERQAIAELAAVRSQLNRQVLLIEQAVGNAYARYRVASAQILASDERIRAATLAFRGVTEEAELGARTTLDVLDAEQDLLDARISRIQAQADLYIAAYSILDAMGLLTVEHLDLGIETYDPAENFEAVRDAPASSPQGERLDQVLDRYLDD